MLAVLFVEIRKLNRSLALLLAVAAPTLIAIFVFFNMLRGNTPQPWEMWTGMAVVVWAFFMLPMSVTALTALVAHMEHGPRAWDHLRALPSPRWRLYAAKAICVVGVLALMSALTLALTWGAAATGEPELALQALLLGKILLAGLLMIAIQLWTALRFASFVPGLALGIGGTFFAVVATSAKQGVFLPWQMPVNMVAREAWRSDTALALGCGLGLVVMAAAVAHLARREIL
jgi:ABC-2 type transport system permease protein